MLEFSRQFWTKLISPIAKLFLWIGISPDVVTVVGTIGVSVGALVFFPRGEFLIGVLIITVFVFSDMIDGMMARSLGKPTKWGAFLDSTLDRIGDAAIFAGLALWFAGDGDSTLYLALALVCLVFGLLTSYTRARAEALDYNAKVGIAERADRLVAILVMTAFSEIFGAPILLEVTLWVLAVASLVTVLQRMVAVRKQFLAETAQAESTQ